jgi:hypothetical protein
VLWANFIGPDLIQRFHRERLTNLNAYSAEWTPDGGLFLRLWKNALDILVSESKGELEDQRRTLAKQFKLARSY